MNLGSLIIKTKLTSPQLIYYHSGYCWRASYGPQKLKCIQEASNDNFMCYYAGLEYSRCDVFRQVVRWGVFGADGLFSVVKEVPNILYPELQGQLGDRDADNFHSEQKELLHLIHPHACAWTLISAARPGRATVRASLNMRDLLVGVSSPEIEGPYLECSWSIAAFSPLTLEQAGNGGRHGGYSHKVASTGRVSVEPSQSERLTELLLVPRSNMKVILLGGPERWHQGVEFIDTNVVTTDHGSNIKEDVGVTHSQDGGNRVYNIECKTVGNYVSVQLSTLFFLLYFQSFSLFSHMYNQS